jgi:hypothetical protein
MSVCAGRPPACHDPVSVELPVVIAGLFADPALIATRRDDALAALAARWMEARIEQLSGGVWEISASAGPAVVLREVITRHFPRPMFS